MVSIAFPTLSSSDLPMTGEPVGEGNSLRSQLAASIRANREEIVRRWLERISARVTLGDNDPGELVVSVRDNGIGVPRGSRERLFQQFYRAHAESVADVDGTGLGLSIARETAESLGGRAWAEFPEEGGSVFAFALPSRRVEDIAAAGTRRQEPGVTNEE